MERLSSEGPSKKYPVLERSENTWDKKIDAFQRDARINYCHIPAPDSHHLGYDKIPNRYPGVFADLQSA